MGPSWQDRQIEVALELAVQAANDPTVRDDRLLIDAWTQGGYLGLVTLAPVSPWALLAVVSIVDGARVPMKLNTMIPTGRREYFAQGAAWWPHPDAPRWLWAVGRTKPTSDQSLCIVRPGNERQAIPATSQGWFAYIAAGHPGHDALVVEVEDGQGRHML